MNNNVSIAARIVVVSIIDDKYFLIKTQVFSNKLFIKRNKDNLLEIWINIERNNCNNWLKFKIDQIFSEISVLKNIKKKF